MSTKLDFIAEKYAQLASINKSIPTRADMKNIGISWDRIRHHFGTMTKLQEYAQELFPKYFKSIYKVEDIHNDIINARNAKKISKAKRLVVTSASSGPLHIGFYKSLQSFCKKNNAELVIMPINHDLTKIDHLLIEKAVSGEIIMPFKDLKVGEKLLLKSIELSEMTSNPSNGLRILTGGYENEQGGLAANNPSRSLIIPSSKQTYEAIPVRKGHIPRCLISTGSVTTPLYASSGSKVRTKSALRANKNHLLGAWVIEIISDKLFIPRQIQANTDGSFPSLGKLYTQDGKVKNMAPKAFVQGDLHSIDKDEVVFKRHLKIIKDMKIDEVVVHDVFDGKSISHHDAHKTAYLTSLHVEDKIDLANELDILTQDLNALTAVTKKVHVVDSNHNDFLQRALEDGRALCSPQNGLISSLIYPYSILYHLKDKTKDLAKDIEKRYGIKKDVLLTMFPDIKNNPQPLEFAVKLFGLKDNHKINWMDVDDTLNIGGFELSMHGHQGSGGAKGSVQSIAQTFDKFIIGHTHSPKQDNFKLSVGHTSNPHPDYAKGGTNSWLNCSALVYETGQVEYLFFIDNKCALDANVKKAA